MSGVLLSTRQLSGGYVRADVVHEIDFSVEEGSIVSIVGPNGHGKTALLWLISGLLKPRAGRIEFDGKDITGLPAHEIARMGLAHAPQGDLLFPNMTIRENLRMGAYRGSSSESYEKQRKFVLDLFPKLAERESQIAGSLSGGERRMVGLGRALMSKSRLLLIDEPSLGLAPIVIDQIYEAIKRLRDQGVTIVLVEENPERASTVADVMHVVDDGHFMLSGTPEEILGQSDLLNAYFG
ncbi:MAG: ABC transporter ATP-binding protein [Roseovarius sp.]